MKSFFTNNFKPFLIDNSGHWVQQEQPKKVFELLNNFYKSQKNN